MGSSAGDSPEAYAALANGDYLVTSRHWDSASIVDAGLVAQVEGTKPTVGVFSELNSVVGSESGQRVHSADGPLPGTFLGAFTARPHGRVYVGVTSLEALQPTFALAPDQSMTIPPQMVASVLERGLDLKLEASNDIQVAAPITVNNPTGNGGSLTLLAGRSLALGANIATDNGNLTLIANDVLASGVVDSQRDQGPGGIGWSSGVSVNAGTGAFRAEVRSGAGKTNSQSGKLELGQLSAGTIFANATGNTLELKGDLAASGNGDAITLVSNTFFEASTRSQSALSTSSGRFLIYAPGTDTAATGAIPLSFREYEKTYPAPPDPAHTGSGILYAGPEPPLTDAGASDASDGGVSGADGSSTGGASGAGAAAATGGAAGANGGAAGDAATTGGTSSAGRGSQPAEPSDDDGCSGGCWMPAKRPSRVSWLCVALLALTARRFRSRRSARRI